MQPFVSFNSTHTDLHIHRHFSEHIQSCTDNWIRRPYFCIQKSKKNSCAIRHFHTRLCLQKDEYNGYPKKKDYSAHIFLYCLVGTYNFNDVLTSAVILHFLITLSTFTLKTSLSVMTYFVCATDASISATFVDILIAIGPCPTWHADTTPYGVTPVHPGPALTHSTTPLSVIWSNTFYKYNAQKFTILNT